MLYSPSAEVVFLSLPPVMLAPFQSTVVILPPATSIVTTDFQPDSASKASSDAK